MSDTFRFTQNEVDEMKFVLEGNAFSRPPRVEMEGMAFSFNNARRQQGILTPCVHVESVHRWFKKKRHAHFRSINKQNQVLPLPCQINDEGIDVTMQDQMLALPCPVTGTGTEVEQAVVRLQKYRKVQPEATESNILTVSKARDILVRMKDTSLADFMKFDKQFELAIQTLGEKGFLSKSEKTSLSSMLRKLREISAAHADIRKEMADHDAFMENLNECEESIHKLIRKADELEEKHETFNQKISNCSKKVAELEAALKKAKAEEEVMKCKKEYIAKELAGLAESLQSANVHHQILKEEEGGMIDKRIKLSQCLQKNAEEWINITHSIKFKFT